jgi:hypothetical protein
VLGALLLVWSTMAHADIVPPNLRPCEGMTPGAACSTDRCTAGKCQEYAGLSCKQHDLFACLMCRAAEGGVPRDGDDGGDIACAAACATTHVPCFGCVPDDSAKESASTTYRWDDCMTKDAGETCRTESCDEGRCGEVCEECGDGGKCEPTVCVPRCVLPKPEGMPRRPLALGVALGAVCAAAVGAYVWRRRRRSKA